MILKLEDTREVNNDDNLNLELNKIIKEKTDKQLNRLSNVYFNKIKKEISINEL